MFLEDVTFVRLVLEGKVSNVTVTALGGFHGGGSYAAVFALADVKTPPVVEVDIVGDCTGSFALKGSVAERITKMVAWLPQNGLALSGGEPTDSNTRSQCVRTWSFTRSDLPF